ncbi:MAG: DUF2750 domain-containing protein [Archangium sp.]|nr:DUF2750 domain-containing protein [Archangium sp.]
MRPTKPGEMAAMLRATANQRYEYFIKHVADSSEAWGLWNGTWAMLQDNSGTPALPLWPAREFTETFASTGWTAFEPKLIELDDFLGELVPSATTQATVFAIFPVSSDKGVSRAPDLLALDLRHELEKYD